MSKSPLDQKLPGSPLPRPVEEPFRLLVESVKDYAIFMLDIEGRISTWNLGAERIKGYRAEEIIGQHFSVFYPAESIATGLPERELKGAIADGRFEDEGWRLRKDGTRFWANVIITALRDDTGELKGFGKVTRDLTTRREMERAQARAEALADLDRRKNEFLAMLSHELRNPLAPILNAVRLLRVEPFTNHVQQQGVDIIERQVESLRRLVDDLLEISRIATGRVSLRKEEVDLRTVVATGLETVRPLAAETGCSLTFIFPSDPFIVKGDSTRLQQIVVNLLTNSVKYNRPNGRVDVKLEREHGMAVLRVLDSGVGITPEMLPHIFNLFTQADKSLERSQGGLGVGLTIVQRLTEMHGGQVTAFSEGIDRGAEFVVQLPLSSTAANLVREEKERRELVSSSTFSILVVDDNRDGADTTAVLLRHLGHHVDTAYSGTQALEAALKHRPDVVLMDIGLPELDGYQVAEKMRSDPELKNARIIALSGYGQESDTRRSKEAGFDAHLVKPVDPEVLADILSSYAEELRTRAANSA